MEAAFIKFENHGDSEFFSVLKKRVENYFTEKGISKKANGIAVLKTSLFFAGIIASYSLILTDNFAGGTLFLIYILWGLSSAFFVFSIAHDASHHAFAKSARLNRLLSYAWNFVGISNYAWEMKHNIAHHTYTNIPGHDMDIDQGALFVLNPSKPTKSHHRYQHLYSPLVYAFYSLYLIYVKDFQLHAMQRFGNKIIHKHPWDEWAILIVTKLFYFTYSFIIPLMVLSEKWWLVVIMYFGMHFIIGLTMAFILGPVHITEEGAYALPDAEGKIHNCWAKHQMECTIDFAADSKLVGWFSGGLNTHIAHHLFPNICHIHYRPLTNIIKQTAQEYGVRYSNKSLAGAVMEHLKFLKKLGNRASPRPSSRILRRERA